MDAPEDVAPFYSYSFSSAKRKSKSRKHQTIPQGTGIAIIDVCDGNSCLVWLRKQSGCGMLTIEKQILPLYVAMQGTVFTAI